MRRSPIAGGSATLELADSDLVARAAAGESDAFETLYRRHSQAAWRVAQAVTHNAHDAADAVSEAFTRVFQALPAGRLSESGSQFRAYLMTATRNAAIDTLRRQGRLQPSDVDTLDDEEPRTGPTDRVVAGVDAELVAAAFRSLPERWRTILWLTEVEGMPPRDAAGILDISANGAAQLAVRARAGLRERYLQAHVLRTGDERCRAVVELLGAYVAGGLAPRDIARVDQHLAGCEACRDRVAELEDLGTSLRRIVLPLPIALSGLGGAALAARLGLTVTGGGATAGGAQVAASAVPGGMPRGLGTSANDTLHALHKPLLYASGVIVALGIMGTAVVGNDPKPRVHAGRPAPVATRPSPANVADAISEERALAVSFAQGVADERDGGGAAVGSSSASASGTGGGATASPPTTRPAPVPVANASVRLGDGTQTAAVSVGAGDGSCTGAQVGSTVVGCAPAKQTPGKQLTISTAGQVPGSRTISAP